MRRIIIGTRGSALALKQTEITADALRSIDPSIDLDIRVIETKGDVNQNPIPLDTIGKGWFTEEIEAALFNKEIDIAVHSLKDMAETMPSGLIIGAYLPREDARDVLLTKHKIKLEDLPFGAIVGTDSARRQVQMLSFREDFTMQSLRGNVPTRIQKLTSENYDAIILAAAGLNRLGLTEKIERYFSVEEITPAPGQGILAIQTREDDTALRSLLDAINDSNTATIAHIERTFSSTVGGGCKAPTGAYARKDGNEAVLLGMIVHTNGSLLREEMRMPWESCENLGVELAQKLLKSRI